MILSLESKNCQNLRDKTICMLICDCILILERALFNESLPKN